MVSRLMDLSVLRRLLCIRGHILIASAFIFQKQAHQQSLVGEVG